MLLLWPSKNWSCKRVCVVWCVCESDIVFLIILKKIKDLKQAVSNNSRKPHVSSNESKTVVHGPAAVLEAIDRGSHREWSNFGFRTLQHVAPWLALRTNHSWLVLLTSFCCYDSCTWWCAKFVAVLKVWEPLLSRRFLAVASNRLGCLVLRSSLGDFLKAGSLAFCDWARKWHEPLYHALPSCFRWIYSPQAVVFDHFPTKLYLPKRAHSLYYDNTVVFFFLISQWFLFLLSFLECLPMSHEMFKSVSPCCTEIVV